MPRYFFHARGPDRFIPHMMGEDHPDLDAARAAAIEIAQGLLNDSVDDKGWSGWSVEVTDEAGDVLFVLALSEISN